MKTLKQFFVTQLRHMDVFVSNGMDTAFVFSLFALVDLVYFQTILSHSFWFINIALTMIGSSFFIVRHYFLTDKKDRGAYVMGRFRAFFWNVFFTSWAYFAPQNHISIPFAIAIGVLVWVVLKFAFAASYYYYKTTGK